MSINNQACIMVGIQRSEIKDAELFERLLEDTFDMGNNHYSDETEWDVIGFIKEKSENTEEISLDPAAYESLKQQFFALTNMVPSIYLTVRCV